MTADELCSVSIHSASRFNDRLVVFLGKWPVRLKSEAQIGPWSDALPENER
jgi:hypothetical protein